MAHVNTTGALTDDTGTTVTQVNLTGQANYLHIRVDKPTYMKIVNGTGTTQSGTAVGLLIATGVVNTFVCGNPPPTHIYWVSTGAGNFGLLETF